MSVSRTRSRHDLCSLLGGGDRRMLAQSQRVRAILEKAPAKISELARLACDEDWLVSMRAMDLLEKLAHEHPGWVQPQLSPARAT